MATVVARLEAILTAQTRDFERSMDKSEHRMSGVGKAAAVAGTAIITGIGYGLNKSVHAALAAQTSQARLEQAFKTSGLSAVKYAKQVDALESSGRKLGFTDEQTKNTLGSLLIATGSMTKASRDLSVAQDVARFKHVGLEQATKMLTMAMAGSQRATKQLGIDVPKVTSAQDALKASGEKLTTIQGKQDLAEAKLIDKHRTSALVIDTVRQKVGGQADAYSKTAAGGMEQFRAQLDHLEVSMGTGLLPILAKVASALSVTVDWFSKNHTVAKIATVSITALGAAFLLASVYAKVMASSLITKVVPALVRATSAVIAMDTAVLAIPAAVAAVVLALVVVGAALVVAYYKVKFFRDGVNATFNWIKENWPLLVGILTGPIGLAVEQIITKRNRIAAAFEALPGMIGNAIGSAIGFLKNKLEEIFDWHRIVGWIKHALGFHSPSPHFIAIGEDIVSSMAHGVGRSAGVLKDAVINLAKRYIPHLTGGSHGSSLFGPGATPGDVGYKGSSGGGTGAHGLVAQVVRAVSFARQHGWQGQVTSGFRTYAQQAELYRRYLAGGPLAAKPGTSSHERGQAVDVTDYGTFGRIMAFAPAFERLYNFLGSRDPVHFSVTGYAQGGIVPGLVGAPQLAVVHGGETITPPGRVTTIHEHHYHGPVMQDAAFVRYLQTIGAKARRRG